MKVVPRIAVVAIVSALLAGVVPAQAATVHPHPNALYGSGTCELAYRMLGCDGAYFVTDTRGRITNFTAPYDRRPDYHCTAVLYNQAKPYSVGRNGVFHFTAVIAQGSHGRRGTLSVSGRFTDPTLARGTYRYDLGSGCHDKRRTFRVHFIGRPASAPAPSASQADAVRRPALKQVVFVPGQSLGKVRLGMTEAQVRRLLGKPTQTYSQPTRFPGVRVTIWNYLHLVNRHTGESILLMGVTFMSAIGNRVQEIESDSPKAHTPGGIKVGSTVAQLRRIYPGVTCDGEQMVCIFGQSSAENHFRLTEGPNLRVTSRTKISGFELIDQTAVGP